MKTPMSRSKIKKLKNVNSNNLSAISLSRAPGYNKKMEVIQGMDNIDFKLEKFLEKRIKTPEMAKPLREKLLLPGSVTHVKIKSGHFKYFYCRVEKINFPVTFKLTNRNAVCEIIYSFDHSFPTKKDYEMISRNTEIVIPYPEEKIRKLEQDHMKLKMSKKRKETQELEFMPLEEVKVRYTDRGVIVPELEDSKDDDQEFMKKEVKCIFFSIKAHQNLESLIKLYYYKIKTHGKDKKEGLKILAKNKESVAFSTEFMPKINYKRYLQFCRKGAKRQGGSMVHIERRNKAIIANYREFEHRKRELFHGIQRKKRQRARQKKDELEKEHLQGILDKYNKKRAYEKARNEMIANYLEKGVEQVQLRSWIALVYMQKVAPKIMLEVMVSEWVILRN
jgi:hypothetical protein